MGRQQLVSSGSLNFINYRGAGVWIKTVIRVRFYDIISCLFFQYVCSYLNIVFFFKKLILEN